MLSLAYRILCDRRPPQKRSFQRPGASGLIFFVSPFSLVSRLWVFILKYDIVLIMMDYDFLALYASVC